MSVTAEIVGHCRITPRALQRLAAAVAADLLGTSAEKISVTVSDSARQLALQVAGPVAVEPLVSTPAEPLALRLPRLREELALRVTQLSGRAVNTVRLEITGAEIMKEARV